MTPDEASLARLARGAQAGDKQAYGALLTISRDWLLRYFRRRVMAEQLDDLVQETLISVHRKLASYDPMRPYSPWLATIARYRWVDHLRRVYRRAEGALTSEPMSRDDEPAIAARISLERLFEALPPAQVRAIELVKIDGLSVAEASHATGQSESLVKINIHRGLKRLAALIEKA